MLKEQTIEKLRKLRLQPIIESVKSMESAPETNSMTHDEWLDVIVGHLYEAKNSKKLDNLIKGAALGCPGAYIEDLCLDNDRGIDAGFVAKLSSGAYITKGHNIIVLSAAGGGKTWFSSALGLSACRQFVKVKYISYRDMLDELAIARNEPTRHKKLVGQLTRLPLLIVDDWLLKDASPGDFDELFAVVDGRSRARKSTILCSQYHIEGWPTRMGGYPAAESVVDRIKNNSYVVELKGEMSMRERYMDEELKNHAKQ
jgi:DNA replication protein DnaC